jgi:hypothetical protein
MALASILMSLLGNSKKDNRDKYTQPTLNDVQGYTEETQFSGEGNDVGQTVIKDTNGDVVTDHAKIQSYYKAKEGGYLDKLYIPPTAKQAKQNPAVATWVGEQNARFGGNPAEAAQANAIREGIMAKNFKTIGDATDYDKMTPVQRGLVSSGNTDATHQEDVRKALSSIMLKSPETQATLQKQLQDLAIRKATAQASANIPELSTTEEAARARLGTNAANIGSMQDEELLKYPEHIRAAASLGLFNDEFTRGHGGVTPEEAMSRTRLPIVSAGGVGVMANPNGISPETQKLQDMMGSVEALQPKAPHEIGAISAGYSRPSTILPLSGNISPTTAGGRMPTQPIIQPTRQAVSSTTLGAPMRQTPFTRAVEQEQKYEAEAPNFTSWLQNMGATGSGTLPTQDANAQLNKLLRDKALQDYLRTNMFSQPVSTNRWGF